MPMLSGGCREGVRSCAEAVPTLLLGIVTCQTFPRGTVHGSWALKSISASKGKVARGKYLRHPTPKRDSKTPHLLPDDLLHLREVAAEIV